MLNKVMLMGHLGKDPQAKTVNNQTVVNFSIATSESYKDKDGNKVDSTEWHNIVIWGNLADIAKQYLKKGSLVFLEGKMKTRSYSQDNVTKYVTEVVCDTMKMLGGKENSNSNNNQMPALPPPPQVQVQNDSENIDDLPF